jgi:hypothetical protein
MGLGPHVRAALKFAGWSFVGNALFPRVAYRLRWPTRLRGRHLLLYVAFNAAFSFYARQWLAARFLTPGSAERVKQQLRSELGRNPTEREVRDRLAENRRWEMMPLTPVTSNL